MHSETTWKDGYKLFYSAFFFCCFSVGEKENLAVGVPLLEVLDVGWSNLV